MQNVDFKDLYDEGTKEINNTHINIGTNKDLSIRELAELIGSVVGYEGEIKFNPTKPDSTMDRLLDCSKIHALGWRHKIELREGIEALYAWYLNRF